MKKIIIVSLLFICFTTACQKHPDKQAFETKSEINSQNIETNKIVEPKDKEENPDQLLPKDNPDIPVKEIEASKEIPDNNEVVIESSVVQTDNDCDKVDEESVDYPVHKGRIDCHSEASCMDKSIPIELKYKQSISNVSYFAVISKADQVLGYFIKYDFKEFKYSSPEECNLIGKEIQTTLSDRVTNYECSEAGILKITTDYGKE